MKKQLLAIAFASLLSGSASPQGIYGGAATIFGSVTAQSFTTSANGTYTPNANLLFAVVECIGQGGGGGGAATNTTTGISSGGGGGSGSYSRVRLTAAQIGGSQATTNTASANGGTAGNNAGTSGNDTSLGSLCIGKGGSGGGGAAAASSGTAGAGGVAGTGDLTIVGQPGFRGFGTSISNTTTLEPSGTGGPGPFGGGAAGVETSGNANIVGAAGTICGGGASGGQSSGSGASIGGGQGGNGCILITEYNSR